MHVIHVYDTFLKKEDRWMLELMYAVQEAGVGISVATQRRSGRKETPFAPVISFEDAHPAVRAMYQAGHPAIHPAVRYWTRQLHWRNPVLVHAVGAWSLHDAMQLADRLHLPLVATVLPRDLHNNRHDAALSRVFDRATAVLTTFASDRDQLLTRGCPEFKTQVWYPGCVELAQELMGKPDLSLQTVELVTGACGEKIEDLGMLVKSVSLAEDPRLHLTILGNKNDHRLQWLAVEMGTPGRISFSNHDSAETQNILRKADAYVLPSQVKFFPAAAIQAALHGAVLVAAESPHMSELIHHERTGLLVEPGSVPALSQAIQHLGAAAERRNHYASSAAHVLTPFIRSKSANHLKGIYEYALTHGRSQT